VPTAGGPHARFALELAAEIARYYNARVMVATIVPASADKERETQARELIEKAIEGIESDTSSLNIEPMIIKSDSIATTLIRESEQHSLTLIGASNQSLWEQLRLGSIPEFVSRRSSKSVVIVHKYEGAIKSWTRRFFSG
jgi:nucleotide-binding universal stress UspA family protein